MLERPTPVDVHPQDDENSRAIMAKIRDEKIIDEATIRTIVDGYEFSSPETKQHTSDRIIDLLRMGVFNDPPLKIVHIDLIDTDSQI